MDVRPAPLVAAGRLLAERGVYGLVWIDEKLMVSAIFGRIVKNVEIGLPVTVSLPVLVGLETEICALRERDSGVLDVPAVSIVSADGAQPRVNLTIFWSAAERSFLLLMARTGARSELEIDLVRQMRARLMAEAEVSAKSRALERANADLEAFASIISHDLKSPVRRLRYMVDDLEASLPEAAQSHAAAQFDHLRAQSRRISDMLSALLEYSSVTRKSEVLEEVDSRALLQAIITSLGVPAGFEIRIDGDWPVLFTFRAPLDLVLRNLVDNAVKHHDCPPGRISLAGRLDEAALTMVVTDDGPGIQPELREAVLLPFRRLDAARDVPGDGMGLALVKRTLDGVGGQMEITSPAPEGRGTTFTISWPRRVSV